MKLSIEFPSVISRKGPEQVAALARAIEAAGYDDIAMFDHVVMGYETPTRPAPIYPSQMPILEALVTLGFIAAVTERVTLATEVLIVPQRQAILVAKQVSTLDTLSGGRMRLGAGVGWQESEYVALGQDFATRGRALDDAIELFRACWGDERIEHEGVGYHADAIAMEPKPPQGRALPIWVGGSSPAALRRTGRLADGWMGMLSGDDATDRDRMATIRREAEAAGRDPNDVQMQAMLAPPPNDAAGKTFYQDHDRVVAQAEHVANLGFGWLALNATAVFQAGARTVDALGDELAALHDRLRTALG